MYEMSQRHPVWVAENHVKPCNSALVQRKLTIAESKYSTFDQEILATITAIGHFRHFLERCEFQL
jgi:hypothetical protein